MKTIRVHQMPCRGAAGSVVKNRLLVVSLALIGFALGAAWHLIQINAP